MVQLYTNEHALDIIAFLQKGYDYMGQCWAMTYRGAIAKLMLCTIDFFILASTYTERQVLENKLLGKCFVLSFF